MDKVRDPAISCTAPQTKDTNNNKITSCIPFHTTRLHGQNARTTLWKQYAVCCRVPASAYFLMAWEAVLITNPLYFLSNCLNPFEIEPIGNPKKSIHGNPFSKITEIHFHKI